MQNGIHGGPAAQSRASRLFRGILVTTLATAGLTACALPGYRSDISDTGHWYEFGSDEERSYPEVPEEEIDYDPRVVSITPSLLKRQARERDNNTLTAEQQQITAAPSTIENYTIGPGDVLKVIVFGQPDLTNPTGSSGSSDGMQGQLVSADGTIYFPYAGEVDAGGMTIQELRRELSQRLAGYIREPQVDVRVVQYRSQRVFISGDIVKPCTVPITDVTLTVLQALDQCDTLASKEGGGVGVQNVVLIRNGESTPLDLNEIYSSGKPIPLRPGDRLLVDDSANRVFMVGEFTEQMALPYSTGGMSLSDAIADAGGVNLETADTSSIYVIRGFVSEEEGADGGVQTKVRPTVFKLDASSVGGFLLANRFTLEPRDVVFAAPASLVNFNRALALITPSLDVLFRSYLLYDRSQND
ncbi:hypothetical protein SAHL_04965 [Salinisphaera orenii YIM 95161]|uniref:Uncharacterized protein n=2 Tax=Salinisphaera TaxID=180541 RepID=A0A423Q1W2_9GAMM|nr:hypothetical protein SAHL_04965 [Salinisphaera halophila YIM 95161]